MRVVAMLSLCVFLAACSENADQRAARDTVNHFYAALKAHDAKTACGLMSRPVADQFLRAFDENEGACVAGLRHLFGRVAKGKDPGFFDSVPTVRSVFVNGDRAVVTIKRNYQRRRVALTRVDDRWQITGSPNSKG